MQTIQEVLKSVNSEEIENEYFYQYCPKLVDIQMDDKRTVREIREQFSQKFQSYLEQTEQSEIVQNLKDQVEKELEEACASNEDLKYLISMLSGDKDEVKDTDIRDYDGASTEATETAEGETPASEESESFETQEFIEDDNS